jgi:hypothetical protein
MSVWPPGWWALLLFQPFPSVPSKRNQLILIGLLDWGESRRGCGHAGPPGRQVTVRVD